MAGIEERLQLSAERVDLLVVENLNARHVTVFAKVRDLLVAQPVSRLSLARRAARTTTRQGRAQAISPSRAPRQPSLRLLPLAAGPINLGRQPQKDLGRGPPQSR